MEGSSLVDLYATKGGEYLLVIGFLILFAFFWRVLHGTARPVSAASGLRSWEPWFRFPQEAFYHRGHSWAALEEPDVLKVGVDDFAQSLLGKVDAIHVPRLGDRVQQGAIAWELIVDSKVFPMRSPVSGQVVAVNEEVLASPATLNEDPYGKGWLMKIRSTRAMSDLANLLSGRLARAWVKETVDAIRERFGGTLGIVLQDGGTLLLGLAKNLDAKRWDEIALEFLLVGEQRDQRTPSEDG